MISKKFCPKCKSEDVEMVAGGITGSWVCGNCGFMGTVFPEKEIIGSEGEEKNILKKSEEKNEK